MFTIAAPSLAHSVTTSATGSLLQATDALMQRLADLPEIETDEMLTGALAVSALNARAVLDCYFKCT
ncbi:MAG: hypothetical protein JHC98_03770 [Thermoleophilaceae bacterium]|nr:hypothetical protein [Thermoleophilaceae bacterium]